MAGSGCSPLWRALTELTSFHNNIHTLAVYARYPRPRQLFDYTLQLFFLTCPPRFLRLPAQRTLIVPPDRLSSRTTAIELTSTFATDQHGAPHAACNLLSHLQQHPARELIAIGVSVPVCCACARWIRLHNHSTHVVRCTDGSWRWPWVMLRGAGARAMAREVRSSVAFLAGSMARSPFRTFGVASDDVLVWRMREMREWWSERSGACVFGCMAVDGCACWEVLFGERRVM